MQGRKEWWERRTRLGLRNQKTAQQLLLSDIKKKKEKRKRKGESEREKIKRKRKREERDTGSRLSERIWRM